MLDPNFCREAELFLEAIYFNKIVEPKGFSSRHSLVLKSDASPLNLGIVWSGPKLPDDSEEVPKPNIVVGGSNPGHEIMSLRDGNTSQVVQRLMCSEKRKKTRKKTKEEER